MIDDDYDENPDETRADFVDKFLSDNPRWSREEAEGYLSGDSENED